MVKPVTGGSSLGARLLKDGSAVEAWLAGDHHGRGEEFAETFIAGRSLTVGVLELSRTVVAAPPLEVVCNADFYDAQTKLDEHAEGLVEYRVPNLSSETDKGLRATAVRIHKLTRCRGFSRVDFVLGNDGVPYVDAYGPRGWVHAGLAGLLDQHGVASAPMPLSYPDELASVVLGGTPVIASVSDEFPVDGRRGGHLVVVTGVAVASGRISTVLFNDPSEWGDSHSRVPGDRFAASFSGRVVVPGYSPPSRSPTVRD
jgi:hypothetical protein